MQNELRYYLTLTKRAMLPISADEQIAIEVGEAPPREPFKPTYMVTAVKLPTGAIELAINNQDIEAKIDYILEAYTEDMALKTNDAIQMQNLMIV